MLPFAGFEPPVDNAPAINSVQAGSTIPVKFKIDGSDATLPDVLAPGYPQSAPVSCRQLIVRLVDGSYHRAYSASNDDAAA